MKYLIKSVNTYRVPTVQDALKLRDELSSLDNVELNSFSYTTKYIKVKGEAVEEYQLVKATIVVNEEKEPESNVDAYYEVRF